MVTAERWGPKQGIDSKDYMPYMENATLGPTGEPQRIQGVSITSPNQNLVDPLRVTVIRTRRGRQVPVTTVKRAAFETYRDYTVGIPIDAFWSPVLEASQSDCLRDFYLYYLCPTDPQYRHFLVLKDCSIDPIIEAQDLLTNGEDNNPIDWTTKITAVEQLRGYDLGVDVIYDMGGTVKANAVAFLLDDCPGCDYQPGLSMVLAGGDGTLAPATLITDNRFSSVFTATSGTAADTGRAVYADGDVILRFDYTGASFLASTAGKSHRSSDRGLTWAVKTIVFPIAAVVGDGSLVFAGGKNAAGDAVLYISTDTGDNWTLITSSAFSAGSGIMCLAYDKESGRLYMGCEDGKVLVGRVVGAGMQITSLTANIGGISINDILGIAVLGENNVVVVGAAGFASETRNGGSTWRQMGISGAAALTCIAGNQYRAYVGSGSNIYMRDILTLNRWEKVTLELGQTFAGTLTSIVMGPYDNFNQFVFTTDAGNVGFAKARYPGA